MNQIPRQIPMPFAARSRPYNAVLIETTMVAAILKISRETVLEWVDCGYLRNVWNLAAPKARSRELRFDYGEVLRVQGGLPAATETPDQVVDRVIGHPLEETLHSETVAAIVCTTRTMVHWWLKTSQLSGPDLANHRQMISRASFRDFLANRWVTP